MEKKVSVSVIIPFYNNVIWLEEAVQSIFSQTYSDYEIIIINDGSNEDISDFVNKYQNKIIYKFKTNGGPGSARNMGIDFANGKYIAFLDSDDLWIKEKLENQVNLMDKTKAVWSHTNWAQFEDGNPDSIIKYYSSGISGKIFPLCLVSSNIATPCVMIRSDYIKTRKDLRFNENMRFGQDIFLWILISLEHPILLIPEILSRARVRGENAVRRARVHLKVRSKIWLNLKDHPSRLFYQYKSLFFVRTAYRICAFEEMFIVWLEKRINLNTSIIEIVTKLIYIPPYITFKILQKYYSRKKCKEHENR